MFINPVAVGDPGMSFSLNVLTHVPVVTVASRQYAGGNFRAVSTPGVQQTAKVELNFCTDAQTAWLKAHQGVLCCFRDPRGGRFHGFYADSTFAPRFILDSWIVPFTVTGVTYNEIA